MVEDTLQSGHLSAAAVLQFAAREAMEGRRLAEFGAHAFSGLAYNPYATLGDMGGSGTSSSSSHMSPGWTTNDLDLDLPGELSMSEALLSTLPSLAGFKQEALSPPGNLLTNPRRVWPPRRTDDRQITNMVVDNRDLDDGCQQTSPHSGVMMNTHSSPESMQCQPMPIVMPMNGYHSPTNQENKGLLMCSPSSLESFLHSPTARSDNSFKDDTRCVESTNPHWTSVVDYGLNPFSLYLYPENPILKSWLAVFKLKGADRKHKQDREKVMRRPTTGHEKYQPGCDATVLTTVSVPLLVINVG
ncbi:jg22471 [Pararge aegeria aegeria]|uniref:Jg22471 protein n=1 Tax=Pararge aegeria aegeria TaxID=348720 RepID=A0A8S4SI64_9NEOP|nr:jg22471 [Pararge aegeria aegeria]